MPPPKYILNGATGLQGARQLAAKAKAARQFTDTSNFTLRQACAGGLQLCKLHCSLPPPLPTAPSCPMDSCCSQVWRVPDRAEGREGGCGACQGHRAHELQRVLSFSQCKPLAEC